VLLVLHLDPQHIYRQRDTEAPPRKIGTEARPAKKGTGTEIETKTEIGTSTWTETETETETEINTGKRTGTETKSLTQDTNAKMQQVFQEIKWKTKVQECKSASSISGNQNKCKRETSTHKKKGVSATLKWKRKTCGNRFGIREMKDSPKSLYDSNTNSAARTASNTYVKYIYICMETKDVRKPIRYSLLNLECHLISNSNLNLLGLFSTEHGKRDLEN